jgi:hypothetical protein
MKITECWASSLAGKDGIFAFQLHWECHSFGNIEEHCTFVINELSVGVPALLSPAADAITIFDLQ